MINWLKKHWEVISYLIFGVLTTLLNIVLYALFNRLFGYTAANSWGNDAQNKTGNQECKTFQTTFHNTVPPLFCYLKLPQSPSVTAPSEREPCRQMQGNASLPEGGGCTAGADRGSYFFLKMISLLNT